MNVAKIAALLACLGSLAALSRAQSQAPTAASALPKDVYPDSRFRLPLPKREDFADDFGKQVFDRLGDPKRVSLSGLQGAGGIRLVSPKIATIIYEATEYLRRETGFGDRITEIAVLTTAREIQNQIIWAAHENAGLKAGVEPALVDVIKFGKPLTGLAEKDAVTIQFGRELFGQKRVSSETFASALRLYGRKGLVDLSLLMSQYASTATLLTAFDAQLPEGQKPLLPAK